MSYTLKYVLAGVVCGCLLAASPIFAHHSVTAEFNPAKEFTMKGTVTQLDWQNPHAYLHMDVKDESGKTVNWLLETYPPSILRRGGVGRDTFKTGEEITVVAFPAKDGTKSLAYLKSVTFADGHSIYVWLGDSAK